MSFYHKQRHSLTANGARFPLHIFYCNSCLMVYPYIGFHCPSRVISRCAGVFAAFDFMLQCTHKTACSVNRPIKLHSLAHYRQLLGIFQFKNAQKHPVWMGPSGFSHLIFEMYKFLLHKIRACFYMGLCFRPMFYPSAVTHQLKYMYIFAFVIHVF